MWFWYCMKTYIKGDTCPGEMVIDGRFMIDIKKRDRAAFKYGIVIEVRWNTHTLLVCWLGWAPFMGR